MKEAKIIAICNQKGGVGKTTTTVNLGIGLAKEGKRVLVIDADPQGDLTTCLGWKNGDELQKYNLDIRVVRLTDAKDPDEYIRLKGVDALKDNIKHAIKYIDFKLEYLKNNKKCCLASIGRCDST